MMYKCNFCVKSSNMGSCGAGLWEKEDYCKEAIEAMKVIDGSSEKAFSSLCKKVKKRGK